MFARALYVYQAEHSSRLKCRQVPVTAGRARTTSPARTSSPPGCTRARPEGSTGEGQHSPSPTTPTQSPFALPGAMAAGTASRYKTGLRLETHR